MPVLDSEFHSQQNRQKSLSSWSLHSALSEGNKCKKGKFGSIGVWEDYNFK